MTASFGYVLAQLQRWTSPRLEQSSDAVLLERFVGQRDESAFAALLARHGDMVLRSCRRILGDVHEAEDAFQATFLILARKAHTLRQAAALPGFLHSVARRVALKARTKAVDCVGWGADATPLAEKLPDARSDPLMQLTAREVLTVFDEEVARLSAAQRSAVLLCCLEGHTREEAAKMLGCTPGSLKGHLERGRQRLQKRLEHRGITLSSALALVAVSHGNATSALLLQNTVKAALHGCIGGTASALAHSVLRTMFLPKLGGVMAVTLTLALAASTAMVLVYRGPAAQAPEDTTPAVPVAAKDQDADKTKVRTDALGDPLPDGAIARLGTVRFRARAWLKHMTFTPDGKRLVIQDTDGVSVLHSATGEELFHLAAEKERRLDSGDLSPDGKLVAVWGKAPDDPRQELCPIELWDVDSGKKIGAMVAKHNTDPMFIHHCPIRFSPDGKLLATSSLHTHVQILDLTTRTLLRSWQVDPQGVGPFVFSADSRKLIACDYKEEQVRVWDVATGRKLLEFKAQAMSGYSTELQAAFAPDGKFLALIESNEKRVLPSGKVEQQARISLRDAETGKLVRQLVRPAYGEIPYNTRTMSLPFRSLTFTPDGKSLITSGPDHCVRIWDAGNGKEQRRIPLEGLPSSLALSRDGKKLAAAIYGGNAIRTVDMMSGQTLTPPDGPLTAVTMADLTPDGRTAVTASYSGSPTVWDVASGKVSRRLKGHNGPAVELRLSNDGRTLYTLGWDKTLRIWDLPTAKEIRCIPVAHDWARLQRSGLPLTPDGKTLAIVDDKVAIRIFDTASGEERQRIPASDRLIAMRLTPDGRSLVAWFNDSKVRVWDVATGRKMREHSLPLSKYQHNMHGGYKAALSPDCRLLAMEYAPKEGEQTCLLILKDLLTGEEIHRIDKSPSHEGLVLEFSPDGRMLAWTSFKDGEIRLLETATGRERRRLTGHRGQITALAFSADGRRLLSGCDDTTALVWDLSAGVRAAATRAEMELLWKDLAHDDAARAYRAIHRFAASPSSAVPFLRKRLRPVAAVDAKRLARLIVELDSDDFAIREKATAELEALGEQALPAYRKALEGKPSLESRRRLEDLQAKAQRTWWDMSGARLRALRAIEALERAATEEAREVLQTLAAGGAGSRLTEEAKAALKRLQR